MKVLLTGAFGNIGLSALRELLQQGHEVSTFGRPSRRNMRIASMLNVRAPMWGDLRSSESLRRAVIDRDVVIHNGALIPPRSEMSPDLAYATNVGGTHNVILAMQSVSTPPSLIYSSSIGLFGRTQHLAPPRVPSDPIQPTNHYTRHKAKCEHLVRGSGLRWTILRFGATPPIRPQRLDSRLFRFVFDIPLDTRVEFLHTADAGLALTNAVSCDRVWGRTLLIGGGPRCQIFQREFIGGMLEATGIGILPDEAFATAPFSLDWLDTDESQSLLRYQHRTFDDFLGDMAEAFRYRRRAARLVRPALRHWILRQSPYYRVYLAERKRLGPDRTPKETPSP